MTENNLNKIKTIPGIDTLYYFCESNQNYEDFYLNLLDQVDTIKSKYDEKYIDYTNSDIVITIQDTQLQYLGKAEGFEWFRDLAEFYKVGFKDPKTNQGLNDIRVQLQGVGIYTIGLKMLIEFINDYLLVDVTRDHYPVTRVDLNSFVQYDLSFINKGMFATRKRNYCTIAEIGTHNAIQTLYVGKEPFKLRLYDKKQELRTSYKQRLMYEYFTSNGFEIEKPIFNIEFQMHRQHLRAYKIDDITSLLNNAQNLFKSAMDEIRLIETSSLTHNQIKHNNKRRAKTLPIWEHIKDAYKVKGFLQNNFPLERVQRKVSFYDDYRFKQEAIALFRKAILHGLPVTSEMMDEYYQIAKNPSKDKKEYQYVKGYTDVLLLDKDSNVKDKYRLLKDGELIKPVKITSNIKD